MSMVRGVRSTPTIALAGLPVALAGSSRQPPASPGTRENRIPLRSPKRPIPPSAASFPDAAAPRHSAGSTYPATAIGGPAYVRASAAAGRPRTIDRARGDRRRANRSGLSEPSVVPNLASRRSGGGTGCCFARRQPHMFPVLADSTTGMTACWTVHPGTERRRSGGPGADPQVAAGPGRPRRQTGTRSPARDDTLARQLRYTGGKDGSAVPTPRVATRSSARFRIFVRIPS